MTTRNSMGSFECQIFRFAGDTCWQSMNAAQTRVFMTWWLSWGAWFPETNFFQNRSIFMAATTCQIYSIGLFRKFACCPWVQRRFESPSLSLLLENQVTSTGMLASHFQMLAHNWLSNELDKDSSCSSSQTWRLLETPTHLPTESIEIADVR